MEQERDTRSGWLIGLRNLEGAVTVLVWLQGFIDDRRAETKRKIESQEAESEDDTGRSHGRGHESNPEGTIRPPVSAWQRLAHRQGQVSRGCARSSGCRR